MDAKQAHQESQKRYVESRFRALRILRTHKIPCVVWAEDALAYYGVPILSFELFVIVADVDAAAKCLNNAGYVHENPRVWEPLPELMEASSRLLQPPASGDSGLDTAQRTIVVLLPAGRWKYALPSAPTSPEIAVSDPFPFPALPALVDSIIDAWLDAPTGLFAGHINCHLAYVYDYIDQVRTPYFVEELQPAHRDFHRRYLASPIRDSQRSEWRRRRDETSRHSSPEIMCGNGDRNPPQPARRVQVSDNIPLQNVGSHSHAQSQPRTSVPASVQNSHRGQARVAAGPSHSGMTGGHTNSSENEYVLEATKALASCLGGDFKWALVGGAAAVALGSRRITEDIDIVIAPPARLREAKNALRSDPRFFIDPRTRHTTFTSSISPKPVDIEFLSFPGTFKAPFDESTKVMETRSGLNVLHLPFLLESKCRAISSRSKESKRTTDAFDIGFILEFMVKNNLRTSLDEVPSASREFQAWFEDFKSGSTRLFHQVGL